jgi:uncharacterized protein YdhG (YjbR/CyaY superfamily)
MTHPASEGVAEVEAYLDEVAEPHRSSLRTLRTTIRSVLPTADERLKYGMPAFVLNGKAVAGYAAFKNHCSYFPMSGSVLETAGDAVSSYELSKGGLRFAPQKPLPVGLVRRLVRLRLDEISAVENGVRYDYYDDGSVKSHGKMKDGRPHGAWRWYRKDGTLMRTGSFNAGRQTGTWETWNRNGTRVSTKHF